VIAMRMPVLTLAAILTASPALAAKGPFLSLSNTDFVVLLAFLLFVGVLVYFKVPRLVAGKLDERAVSIRSELDEARRIREEAQELLDEYERKRKDALAQADRIVEQAREEARLAGEEAKKDIETSIKRRLQAAEEQIGSAEARAIRDVRDQAITVATAAARKVVAKQMTAEQGDGLIDAGIDQVGSRLN